MTTQIILSHIDDETFSLSGFLQNISQKENVFITYLCFGRDNLNSLKRFDVLKKISSEIGFEYECLGYKDLELEHIQTSEIANKINQSIKKINPERIITHCDEDLHQDHVKTSKCVKIALKRIEQTNIKEFLEVKSPENYPFQNVYFDTVYKLNNNLLLKKEKYINLYKYIEKIPFIDSKEYFRTVYRELK